MNLAFWSVQHALRLLQNMYFNTVKQFWWYLHVLYSNVTRATHPNEEGIVSNLGRLEEISSGRPSTRVG
jgi:hypothetical protein